MVEGGERLINTEMLKERAKELGIRQKDIADALGLQQSSVNLKLNNQRPMTIEEAEIIADLLNISDDMFGSYFFSGGASQVVFEGLMNAMTENKIAPAVKRQELDIDVDRLGLAYCRLNRWEWDEILGPKPEGFDELPNWWEKRWPWEKWKPSKDDYIGLPMQRIRSLIGEVNISRCWLKYEYGCEDQWLQYYLTGNIYISRSNGE